MPPKSYQCLLCGFCKTGYKAVWRHVATLHMNTDFIPFTCECGKVFLDFKNICDHLRRTPTCTTIKLKSEASDPSKIMISKGTVQVEVLQQFRTESGQGASIVDNALETISDSEMPEEEVTWYRPEPVDLLDLLTQPTLDYNDPETHNKELNILNLIE